MAVTAFVFVLSFLGVGGLTVLLRPTFSKMVPGSARAAEAANLTRIGLAIHAYHDD